MAALCPGVQYGLSSHQNFGENKDLIFVKLTDSALRAIEEYLKNQNKLSQTPKIRFLGNENGELSFPSVHHDTGSTSFSFSVSSTSDMEGPGGSFECIQQMGSPRGQLESLGSIPRKIRVHANEDVYEVTRNRMTEAEDKYKNKCTREIKPTQTEIGRRGKVKQIARPPILPAAGNNRREPMPSMRDSLLKQPSSYQSVQSKQPAPPIVHSSTNGFPSSSSASSSLNGLGSNHVSSSVRPATQYSGSGSKKPSEPSIARRPLKERLIHLLAVRPLKKPELCDRLSKEGFRGTSYMSVVKQIAHMKDNCFHLNRSLWNEVNEDWPFYTENEKQALKRRKPQNLTPPGSSDGGSSGSGQSPTSTHPGSPPPPVTTPSVKRPGFHDGPDGFPYKKQRIAHGNKMADSVYRTSPIDTNNSQRRPATDLRDASNMNPRSRESPTNGYFNSYPLSTMLNNNADNNADLENTSINKRQCDSQNNSLGFGVRNDKIFRSQSPVSSRNNLPPDEPVSKTTAPERNSPSNNNNRENGHHVLNGAAVVREHLKEKDKDNSSTSRRNNSNHINNNSSSNNNNSRVTSSTPRISRVSPDSQSEGLQLAPSTEGWTRPEVEEEFPDYKKDYVTINDVEQRRRYKADFNADYAEYRDLHGVVEKVSKRFAQLEERLKQEDESSPQYKDIKRQIVREYQENKKDLEHQKAKRRFQYLHEKLSHIKRLVSQYDINAASTRDY